MPRKKGAKKAPAKEAEAESGDVEGPATVRMVSGSLGPPVPLPLHVPPGHIVQQIVDQDGTLRHLILSPQHPPPLPIPGPAGPNGPANGPPNGPPMVPRLQGPPPLFPGEPELRPDLRPDMRPELRPELRKARDGPAPRDLPRDLQRDPLQRSDHLQREHHLQREAAPAVPAEQRSNSGASNASDEKDSENIKSFLSRIRAPTVHDIGPREALVRWEALDCSEASASGGPFPYIDSSEFTYEVLVTERLANNKKETWSLGPRTVDADGGLAQQRLAKLRPSTDYSLRVRADLLDRGISGEPSHALDFKTKPTQPDKPQTPTCIGKTKNSLQMTWRKPMDNGAKILAYRLEVDEGRGEWRAAYEGPDLKHRLQKLQPNSTYSCRVVARNVCGESEASDVFLAHTSGAAPTTPEAPRLLAATPSSLQLAWAKRAGDDRFSLQMEDPASNHGFIPVASTAETLATVKGLAKAKEYRFRLLAENDDGKSAYSEAQTFRTAASQPGVPGKPYLKDRVKSSSLRLAWEPPSDSGGVQIAQYLLEYVGEAGGTEPKTWTTLYSGEDQEYFVQALLPGTGYRFRVSCSGEGGGSGTSDVLVVSTTPLPPSPPATPTLVRAKPNSLQLKWTAPKSTGGADVTEYELQMASPSKPHPIAPYNVFTGAKNEVTLPNLLPGRSYSFNVRALNRAGPSPWSQELKAETSAGPPDAVCPPRLASPAEPRSVRLAWDPPLLTNGSPVTEYRLFKAIVRASLDAASSAPPSPAASTEAPGTPGTPTTPGPAPASPSREPEAALEAFAQVWSGASCSAEIKGLRPASGYAFHLMAANAAGLSAPSEDLMVRTPCGPPSAPPSPALEALGLSQLLVSWEAPPDSGSPITGYRLEVPGGPEKELELPADALSATLDGLEPETSYKVRLAASNEVGEGEWSGWARGATFSRPPPPPLLELVSAGSTSLKLRWTEAKSTSESLVFGLEMENRHGSFSPVFEGSAKSHKVQRLTENSEYRFRVRAGGSGGVGQWSEPRVFRTARAAPPALKAAPKVVSAGGDAWQVEWVGVKASALPKGDRLHYLVEMEQGEQWTRRYQGSSLSYTLSGVRSGSGHRVRVSTVRISPVAGSEAVEETVGPAAVSSTFGLSEEKEWASGEGRKRSERSVSEEGPAEEAVAERRFSDSQFALLILAGFSLAALLIAYLLQNAIAP